MKPIRIALLICFCVVFHAAFCQKKNSLGIAYRLENTSNHSELIKESAIKKQYSFWNSSYGVVYERTFSKHSSGIIGIKFRQALNDLYIPVPVGANSTAYQYYQVMENFLTIPLYYKYNSGFLSISAGPSFDFFLSAKEKQSSWVPIKNYDAFMNKKLSIGLLTSISKKFNMGNGLILEPVVYYNRILSFERTYFGCGFDLKQTF